MSFDKGTRNALAKMVVACRTRLTADVTDQLQSTYGLHPDGIAVPVERLGHLTEDQKTGASGLRELLDHFTLGAEGNDTDRRRSAYNRVVLEISFTILNRLAAVRLCEERELILESVRQGMASDGFRLFEQLSGGALGTRYETYRIFLESLFDELAVDLGVLFDKTTPQSIIFPSERCLEEILNLLNDKNLGHLWREDETIGWIYQYFNPAMERKAMREASAAPRNSRELAVRNQFFTPRYVVEFLTDNTLGRIWYEMRRGDTALKDDCRYLVRRPNEIFLRAGEKAPAGDDAELDRSQEELLKKPVYIEHRPKKDPRDLKILDPACGSGHFLLYAFDLLERIYQEAWEDPESPKSDATGRTLREDYGTVDDLRSAIPELILRWNLHGIDIDPRAVQIAVLALWLRAQGSYQSLGLKFGERPRIIKSNIVCAEPMPGEIDLLKEFTAELKPTVLGQLVEIIFEKMRLAGEAGSLLKIEEEIKDAVAGAKRQWLEGPRPEQLLFPGLVDRRPEQQELRFDLKGIKDEEFWEQAEEGIVVALKQYAEQAENGRGIRLRLFADDAARGFAFIDLCRKRYDIVLMNPPFGDSSQGAKRYIDTQYSEWRYDLYPCFVSRANHILSSGGRAGAITNRTGFFLSRMEQWREKILLGPAGLICMADLGHQVLDNALVEVAAYVTGLTCDTRLSAFSCLRISGVLKGKHLAELIRSYRVGNGLCDDCFTIHRGALNKVPLHAIVYWIPSSILRAVTSLGDMEDAGFQVREGLHTSDNERFLRLWWESPALSLQNRQYVPFAKGGDYAPYHSDLHLCLSWRA